MSEMRFPYSRGVSEKYPGKSGEGAIYLRVEECPFCHQVKPVLDIDPSYGEYEAIYICEECTQRAFREFANRQQL